MVPRKVMATILVLYVVAMLAKQSEGFLAFHSRKALEEMLVSVLRESIQ